MAEAGNRRRAKYFFGAGALRDLFLVDEMRRLEEELHDFTFIPALSEPEPGLQSDTGGAGRRLPGDDWKGETGLITEVVDRHITSGENIEAYLCGSPGMIDACIEVLKGKGVPEDLICYDKFE